MKKVAIILYMILAIGIFYFTALAPGLKTIQDNKLELIEQVKNFEQCLTSKDAKECQEHWMTSDAKASVSAGELSTLALNIKTVLGVRRSATLDVESFRWKFSLGTMGVQFYVSFDLKVNYENDPAVTQTIALIKTGSGPFLLHAFDLSSKTLSSVEQIQTYFRSQDPKLRLMAAEAAPKLPHQVALTFVPLLITNINDNHWSADQAMQAGRLPEKSVEAILKIDPQNAMIIAEVWKLLNSPLSKTEKEKIPELTALQAMQLKNSVIALAPRKLELMPVITEILKDNRPAGYYRIPIVIGLLSMIGGPIDDVPKAIRQALLSKQSALVGEMCLLMQGRWLEIDKRPYLPDIKTAMNALSGFDPNRSQCAQALIFIEPHGKTVGTNYLRDLKSPDPRVRRAACDNINFLAINRNAEQVIDTVPLLLKLLNDENDQVRFAAGIALGAFHSKAEQIVPLLLRTIKNGEGEDPSILGAVTHSVISLDSRNPNLASTLMAHLNNKRLNWRQRAALELASLGKMAKPAVPTFYKILKNPSENLGLAAYATQGLLNAGEDPKTLKALFEAQRKQHPDNPQLIAPWETQAAENVATQLGILPGKVQFKVINPLPGLE